jgi:hypothetical protein
LLLIVCASAISATSLGKFVRSAAQSRNVERKRWAGVSPGLILDQTHRFQFASRRVPMLSIWRREIAQGLATGNLIVRAVCRLCVG